MRQDESALGVSFKNEGILLFGKQYTNNNKQAIGGVITLFELLKKDLMNLDINYKVVDTNWRNYSTPLHAYFYILYKIIKKDPNYKYISFHGTANEFFYLTPILVFFAKINKKKISLRKFAGNFDEYYDNANYIKKILVKYALSNADCLFFETKYLVKKFKEYNKNTYWFPNVRKVNTNKTSKEFNSKYIFVGQVKKTKGVDEILDAFNNLANKNLSIDLYGPLSQDYTSESVTTYNVKYKGILEPNEVQNTLVRYDVLVLPTYHRGEGYPGVILEAFSVGMPVISSKMRGIIELVDESSGILIDSKSVNQLCHALDMFDQKSYLVYREGAIKRFEAFDSENITLKFIESIY